MKKAYLKWVLVPFVIFSARGCTATGNRCWRFRFAQPVLMLTKSEWLFFFHRSCRCFGSWGWKRWGATSSGGWWGFWARARKRTRRNTTWCAPTPASSSTSSSASFYSSTRPSSAPTQTVSVNSLSFVYKFMLWFHGLFCCNTAVFPLCKLIFRSSTPYQ